MYAFPIGSNEIFTHDRRRITLDGQRQRTPTIAKGHLSPSGDLILKYRN